MQHPGRVPLASQVHRQLSTPGHPCPACGLRGGSAFFFLWKCGKSLMRINIMVLPCGQGNKLLSTFFQWTLSNKDPIRRNSLKASVRFTIDPKL